MSAKLFIGIISVLLDGVGYYPYFRDILKKQTKPHLYTWLIWIITQGTATVAMIYGGANFGAWPFITGTILVALVFALSFKYGTKDITRSDTILLIFALLAVATWCLLNSPVISVAMVTIIDAIGFIPTIRKSYTDPWSETVFFWVTMSIIDILAILALEQYNFLTVTYSVMLIIGNSIVVTVCLFRRKIKVRA